jgi:hypothetical protein
VVFGAERQVRTGLSAGGKWIRTLGPARSPASNGAFYITRIELYIDTGERGAASFGGDDGPAKRRMA